MKIGLIGAGRLGICFALLLEKIGYEVIVSDCRNDYVIGLNDRIINTNEPQVAEMLDDAKNFTAVFDNIEVIKNCDIIYTLVATPSLPDGRYDVSAVQKVIKDIQSCNFPLHGKSLVIGCTTNPGDCQVFQTQLKPYGVDVYYNPEFVAQGSIIKDLQCADMVLIGGKGNHVNTIKEIYFQIQKIEPTVYAMSTTSAEIVKLAVNCFLTTKISYANMIGEVMTLSGLEEEIQLVLNAIGSDSRIGFKFLKYGFGFGGPCLPRDNRSLAAYANKLGLKNKIGEVTDAFNIEHFKFILNYSVKKNKNNLPFYFDTLSYKKGVDLLIESQQFDLCCMFLELGYKVYVNQVSISNEIKDELKNKYDKIYFVTSKTKIYEEFIDIEKIFDY